MGNRILIGVAAVIILLVASVTAAAYLKQNQLNKNLAKENPQATEAPSQNSPTPTSDTDIPEDWLFYQSEDLQVMLRYPPEVSMNEQPDGTVNFSLLGPTQKEGTEFYDGLTINIEPGTYTQGSFEDFVNEIYEDLRNDRGHVSQITPLTKDKLNGNDCYKFTTTSTMFDIGEVNYIYLQKNEGEYIQISTFVSDPTDQGYEQTLDKILSTLGISDSPFTNTDTPVF